MEGSRGETWILHTGEVPERWRDRAEMVALIRLLPGEAGVLLGGNPALPDIDAVDEPLLRLVGRGMTAAAIGRELGLSPRSVERRLARIRTALGVSSREELIAYLARRGFDT